MWTKRTCNDNTWPYDDDFWDLVIILVWRCFEVWPANPAAAAAGRSWSPWDRLDGPRFYRGTNVVHLFQIRTVCNNSSFTSGHKGQCWQRPAAPLENHRGRNRNYIKRWIYMKSLSAYLYQYQRLIVVFPLMQLLSGFRFWTWSWF